MLHIAFRDNVNGILESKVIQEKIDRFTVIIVKSKSFTRKTINQIYIAIKKTVKNDDIEINIKIVDEIPREKSGKKRMFISKVNKKSFN